VTTFLVIMVLAAYPAKEIKTYFAGPMDRPTCEEAAARINAVPLPTDATSIAMEAKCEDWQ